MALLGIAHIAFAGACKKTENKLHDVLPQSLASAQEPVAPQSVSAATNTPGDDGPEELISYPPGRWRLVRPETLDGVMLWVSHILIRHQDVRGTNACFGPPGWSIYPPPPPRTRGQAIAIAQEIAAALHVSPERFDEVAAGRSEDVATRGSSGSLGGVNAVDFLSTPTVLDALASLAPGEISRVVETRCGFHVLRRNQPAPDQTVSGAHIVIGHRDARWLHRFGSDSPIPDRSRAEALELADTVYSLARSHPEKFDEYVRQYSEHRDAAQGGDLGEWSTRELPRMARQVDVLAKLAVGEVAQPIDTIYGVEILIRTPNRHRKRYAMEAIKVMFDGAAPDSSSRSKTAAWNVASGVAATLRADHSQFSTIQQSYCCPGVEIWTQGRSSEDLESQLDELRAGEIMKHPVQAQSAFVIARPVRSPQIRPPSRARLELPAPEVPDVAHLVGQFNPVTIQMIMRDIAKEEAAALQLSEQKETEFIAMHELGPSFLEGSSAAQRRDAFVRARREIEGRLKEPQVKSYRSAVNQAFEQLALSTARKHLRPKQH